MSKSDFLLVIFIRKLLCLEIVFAGWPFLTINEDFHLVEVRKKTILGSFSVKIYRLKFLIEEGRIFKFRWVKNCCFI